MKRKEHDRERVFSEMKQKKIQIKKIMDNNNNIIITTHKSYKELGIFKKLIELSRQVDLSTAKCPKDIKEQFVYKINELIFESIKKVRIAKSRPASDIEGKLEDIFDIFENLDDIDGYLIIMLNNKKISDKKYSIILEVFDQLIDQLSRWSVNLRRHLLDANHN